MLLGRSQTKSKSVDLLERRDLTNFLRLRSAHPGDDIAVGELLVTSFKETYAKKLPYVITSADREDELRDVSSRRRVGIVRVVDFGYRVIGTYSLIHPESEANEAWTANTCTLRCLAIDTEFHSLKLSELLLLDAVEIATSWKAQKICLHVQDGAAGVARLYETFGFRRCEEGDKEYYGMRILAYIYDIKPRLVEAESSPG